MSFAGILWVLLASQERAAPATKSGPTVTLAQFEQAVQISKVAAGNGLTELSIDGIAQSLQGGPPVVALPRPDQINPDGRRKPDAQNAIVDARVQLHLSSLEQIWRKKGVADEQIYTVFRRVVFPELRPLEIYLYSGPLLGSPNDQPQSASAMLVAAAIRAGKVDELKSLAQQHLQQPLGEFPARILLGQLALALDDKAAVTEQLTFIASRLKQDSLQRTSELACHVALPAMMLPDPPPVAVELVAQAVDELHKSTKAGRGGGQSEPVTSLTFRLANHYFQNRRAEDGKALLESWISLQGPLWSAYGGDYPALQQRMATLRVASEFFRAGLKADSLEILGRFAELIPSRDFQSGPGKEGSVILSGLAALSAAERYELLKSWTLPTKDRQSVRLVIGFVPADRAPAIFDAVRGPSPRSPQTAQLMSTLDLLISAAREMGKLDELQSQMEPHATAKIENAIAALAMIRIANGQGTKTLDALKGLNELRAKEAAQAQGRVLRNPTQVNDSVLARAALLDVNPAVRDQGRRLGLQFIAYTQRNFDQMMMPVMRHAMRSALIGSAFASDLDVRMSETGLRHWVAGSTSSATTDQQIQSLPPWWHSHEDMISHTCGMGGDYLYFNYPLTGKFEMECEGMLGSWADSNIGFGGIVFLGLHGGTNINIFPVGRNNEFIVRPDPVEDGNTFNRLKLSVNGDQVTYRINGHPIHVATKVPGTSPFLMLYSERQWDPIFRNIKITGSPVVPREVSLVVDHSLLGWACNFYAESQPRFLPPNDYQVERYNANRPQIEPGDHDWLAADGEIHGRIVPGVSIVSAATLQSRLCYNRPLRDREMLKYEFWYEPGDGGFQTHPALDRLAFLLEPEGVRVHWMTPSNDPADNSDLPANNAVVEQGCRRGPDKSSREARAWPGRARHQRRHGVRSVSTWPLSADHGRGCLSASRCDALSRVDQAGLHVRACVWRRGLGSDVCRPGDA